MTVQEAISNLREYAKGRAGNILGMCALAADLLESNVSRWISVEEQPPVWPCVVYDGHNPPYIPKGCIAMLHDTEGSVKWIPEIPLDALMQGNMPELHNIPITHWMPLPESPKEEHK